jgi:hypothetical protein
VFTKMFIKSTDTNPEKKTRNIHSDMSGTNVLSSIRHEASICYSLWEENKALLGKVLF